MTEGTLVLVGAHTLFIGLLVFRNLIAKYIGGA